MVGKQCAHALSEHLHNGALSVTNVDLDHFPPLIVYQCLEGSVEKLANAARMAPASKSHSVSESITTPRKGFGPAPVVLLSPSARTSLRG